MEWRNTAHVKCVNNWMAEAANGLSSEQVLDLFEQAMLALWNRSVDMLGVITLTAILDRVMYPATKRFPQFKSLKVVGTGIDAAGLRESTKDMTVSQLVEGIRLVLVEFLSLTGYMTAEVLTPALHSELSKVKLKKSTRGIKGGGE